MTRDEFKKWLNDFSKRFPSTGEWLKKLDRETLEHWFDGVWSSFELRDALAVNERMMIEFEIEPWERERLPKIFIKRLQEQRYYRNKREEDARNRQREIEYRRRLKQQRRDGASPGERLDVTRQFTTSMVAAYSDLREMRRDYRKDHGEYMPDVVWRKACDEYLETHEV